MRRAIERAAAVGTVAFAAALTTAPVSADLSLDVQPARYELEATPGATQTFPITVRNTGSGATHVVVSLNDFAVRANGQYAFLPAGATKFSAGKWASVNPREFDLEPGAFIQVRYTIDVPRAAVGEYNSLVFFSTRPARKPGTFGLTERIASRVYVLAGDTGKAAGEVADVSTRPLALGRSYAIAFKNTGTMHVYLNGKVAIKRGDQTVEQIDLPKDTLVERGGTRSIDVVGHNLAPGSYAALAIVDYGGATRVAGQTTFVVR